MVGVEENQAASSIRRVSGHGGNPPGSGPFMIVTLEVSSGVVRDFAFETYACPGAHTCGKALGELIKDQPLETARGITRDALVERVGPLPPSTPCSPPPYFPPDSTREGSASIENRKAAASMPTPKDREWHGILTRWKASGDSVSPASQ